MVSTQPWSDFSSSDYSIEQWHNACLIHQHDGPPVSKTQCKLPVKTPSGAVNKNGVFAAAAALAGARGGVNATDEQKNSAKESLKRLYSQLGETVPDSLKHYGVKGMKWGVRRDRSGSLSEVTVTQRKPGTRVQTKGGKGLPASEDARKAAIAKQKARASTLDSLSNKELREMVNRMNLENQYANLNRQLNQKSAGRKFLEKMFRNPQERERLAKDIAQIGEVPVIRDVLAAKAVGDDIKRMKL